MYVCMYVWIYIYIYIYMYVCSACGIMDMQHEATQTWADPSADLAKLPCEVADPTAHAFEGTSALGLWFSA